ncbi:MAG: 2-phospho-L-lactate transferase [Gammaproteobacteria bacterium]|jgi:LPPG:FO 2-phospho-L-lactate transferase|nr:2-phospho-L-lactate transferase [Gammaproteobacteria bacterium]MDP6617727.1 2-phospho-L-lactate transferase [Gammaproteobacteria bacterium]MDP6694113.1 2-phospho-L-lactate transferase [Gammaproteobacteria bacterium]MDP7041876.1 2-phospho-L-lactate transferase [Gammaproteobacteria bacterium]
MSPGDSYNTYTVLSGGVGGAKLALGLDETLTRGQLSVIANTGDDFEHLGLKICPDIDTLIYTLAGIADPETGWGLNNESWQFMESLEKLGGETWFRLGDRDLATHLRRKELLETGRTLTEVTAELCRAMGVEASILPMSDDPVSTRIHTKEGALPFQEYFVRLQTEPVATGFDYAGSETARATADVLATLKHDSLAAIFIAPSNPWLSIDPILSLGDIKSTIIDTRVPVVAVSPIVAGKALKGPTAKLMEETGLDPSVTSIAGHYSELVDGLIIDEQDASLQDEIEDMGLRVGITRTVMNSHQDKVSLAEFAIEFAALLGGKKA